MNGRIFKISMKTGWNRKLSTNWKNWISHCKYFLETIEHEDAPGRKIGFIAQEIGREINTMGSKANDHDIQKLVVKMKDELEKIKEQSLNVL